VLEAIMEHGPVLPVRFGTDIASDEDLAGALSERQESLLRALEQVRGRVELGVRALSEREDLPRDRATSGRDYLLSRVATHRRAEEAARELHHPLAELAVAARTSERPSPPAVMVGSYLVEEPEVEDFRRRAEELGRRHADLHVVVTGPWPPYTFAGEELE
jgi:gas vesicle protein GvpL/GvpF